jgi:predicted nucleic acid-binding protein
MIFVDTGAWYASLVPTDPDHTTAAQWLATNRSPLLTTDYVVDETLTLLRSRGEKKLRYCWVRNSSTTLSRKYIRLVPRI